MKTDNAVTLLRSLKGAPLSVLIAIRLFPGPASLLQLAAATGYERTAVSQAVTSLEMMGYVERAHYRGWQLSRLALQLPLWAPSEIGTISPDAPLKLGAGDEIDGPEAAAPKADKNHFQRTDPTAEHGAEILKAGKNRFQQEGAEAAEEPEILKAGKNHFQQAGAETAEEPAILKAGKNHFQQDDPETGDERAILKAGKNHFQQEGSDIEAGAENLKAVKNHFQPPDPNAEPLKAGKNHFQPDDGSGSSSLINLTTRVKPLPLLQPDALKAGKNHFQPAEPATPPHFDDAELELLQDLIDLTGCPRRRAEAAIRRARTAGADTSWLHLQVLYWHAYLANGRANSIQNPGYFVAKKLEEDEACPLAETISEHRAKATDLHYRLEGIA